MVKKHITSLLDLDKEDFELFFDEAFELKKRHGLGICESVLRNKTLGLIFEKPSTRTRVSFETAMVQLGGTPLFISAKDTQIARNEPIKDTARVLSRYVDILAIRTFSQDVLNEFSRYSNVPVINALTDIYHPCQVMSDIMTLIEVRGGYKDKKIAWVGDGNNVANSWINAAAVLDLDLSLACPRGYQPKKEIMEKAGDRGGKTIRIFEDPLEAVDGADLIYTDVWTSMGQEDEENRRSEAFRPFQVNSDLVARAGDDVIVMHCLPAHRGDEITEEVLEGQASVVWDQAENKMHMHKAILKLLISGLE